MMINANLKGKEIKNDIAGKYEYKIKIISMENLSITYTSDTLTFNVLPNVIPWWIVIVIVGAFLLLGLLIIIAWHYYSNHQKPQR